MKIQVPGFMLAELDRQIARTEKVLVAKQKRLAELKALRAKMELEPSQGKKKRGD